METDRIIFVKHIECKELKNKIKESRNQTNPFTERERGRKREREREREMRWAWWVGGEQ